MAIPRVFVSSTYYDFKTVRSDLERFIETMGYEPVLNEKGHIPYGNDKKLEEYCYKEVGACDMVVSIIGGRYGSGSSREDASISQMELKTAIDLGKQVYVFVDKSVKSEHRFVQKNRGLDGLQFTSVDNKKIFDYLDFVESLPLNNATFGFEVANDIIALLREQWAGLFKSFLQDSAKEPEKQTISEIKETAQTLRQLVGFLAEDKKNTSSAIQTILSVNHPIFNRLKKLVNVPYRIYFSNRPEMVALLKARQYNRVDEIVWDEPGMEEFVNNQDDNKYQYLLKVKCDLFADDETLRIFTPEQWKDAWVSSVKREKELKKDDEPPF